MQSPAHESIVAGSALPIFALLGLMVRVVAPSSAEQGEEMLED